MVGFIRANISNDITVVAEQSPALTDDIARRDYRLHADAEARADVTAAITHGRG